MPASYLLLLFLVIRVFLVIQVMDRDLPLFGARFAEPGNTWPGW